ncbi:autotransporter outer membrane beta-barrel domain-containing protein [Bartonella sp. B30(2025)]
MQCKFKLRFLALVTSNFFVKAISANEMVAFSHEDSFSLLPVMIGKQLEEVNKKRTIRSNPVEDIIKNAPVKATDISAQVVLCIANEINNTRVSKGMKQIVTGTNECAYNTTVLGLDQKPGRQIVYDKGVTFSTQVKGGVQQLGKKSAQPNQQGALSIDTIVYPGGKQRILAGNKALNTILDGGILKVDSGGVVDTLTIIDHGKAQISAGAILKGPITINDHGEAQISTGAILKGPITVNDYGRLNLGVNKQGPKNVESITLGGRNSLLELVTTGSSKVNLYIKKLDGKGHFVFSPPRDKKHYSTLYVTDLSGNINFYFNIDPVNSKNNSLFIRNGQGDHTVNILDTGTEITTYPSFSLNLITDLSGKAHFTLKNYANATINAVDSGAYMYHLRYEKIRDDGKVWYLSNVKKDAVLFKPESENNFNCYTDGKDINFFGRPVERIIGTFDIFEVDAGDLSRNTIVLRDGTEIVKKEGISEFTLVQAGGKQSVEKGGVARGTTVYGGTQSIFGEGEMNGVPVSSRAYNTHIYSHDDAKGEQKVYGAGIAWGTKVMAGGMQTIAKWFPDDEGFVSKRGGIAIDTEVCSEGKQRILEGGKAYGVILHPHATQEIHAGGYINGLEIKEGANSWALVGSILEGKTVVHDFGKLHLYAGESNYKAITENINLTGEKAQLYLVAHHSDGHNSWIQNLNGVGEVIFTSDNNSLYYSNLYIDTLSGNMHFHFNVSLAEKKGDHLFIKNGNGSHTISVVDSGLDIISPLSTSFDLIFDESGQAHFTLKDISGVKIGAVNGEVVVDGGTYVYALKEKSDEDGQYKKIWYLTVLSVDEGSHVSPKSPTPFLTSPSTDAVLSMSVVPGIIFYNELQAVRAERRIVNGNKTTTSSFWIQAIKYKEHIATGHIDFKLDQTGIILGVNGLSELMSGEFYIGGFGSYDQARVAHARKGTSSINSYSVGAYATYFDYSGWYLDAVLKYNNYQNDLNAVSTNGLDIHGNYNQWAIGTSLETGYRFKLSQQGWMQPYGGLTWLQAANKEIKLSNGMMGDLSRLTSLQSEVGVSVGYEFGSDTKTPSVAYIMASWVRENITKNYTTINKQHKFVTDLSGHAGKLGIGLNSSISDRLMVFAEASYLQGQKIKQSFQGTLGLRYSF